jgi:putative ABC transport system permease protein
MSVTPPRLALWLLARRLSSTWRDFIVGDLTEEFQTRARTSPVAARRWFWRQTVRCLIAPPPGDPHNVTQSSRVPRESRLRTILADLRHGLRVMYRAPAFALAVIAVLALGIGANTAIFSIVNTVLLRPLPFQRSNELVRLFHVPPQDAFPGIAQFPVSPANFYDWKRDARSFDGMAIYRGRAFTLLSGGHAETVTAAAVGADFFAIVGTPPAMGRVFSPDEDIAGREHVVVLSHAFWTSHFGAAHDAVGRTLTLNREPYTIVGVMPPEFAIKAWGGTAGDLWVPLAYTDAQRAVRENHNAAVVARLKPGVTLTAAQAEMNVISERLEREYPKANAGWGAVIIPLQELIVGDIRASLLVLLAAVGLVLLIACANVGNLLFARTLTRRKEFALRSALGASRGRVFQHVFIESLVLSLIGGAMGLALARFGLVAAGTMLRAQVPRIDEITLDWHVMVFVFAASVITAVLAGAVPALRAGGGQLTDALKEGGRSDGAIGVRTRRVLVVGEVALSLVLLMGAGVMVRTVSALRHVDAGVDARNVLTMQVLLPATRYDTAAKRTAFFDAALQKLGALPGVQTAAAIDDLPSEGGSVQPVVIEGKAELLPRDQPTTEVRTITPGYLRAMGIPLLRGRDVIASDRDVMLVSQSAAKLLWGSADPIGRHAMLPLSQKQPHEVVGIVGDVIQLELTKGTNPTVYRYTPEHEFTNLTLVARTSVPPLSLAKAAIEAIQSIDPEQPVENVRPMTDVLDASLRSQRFSAQLLAVFAAVALTLASIGIYSVLSFIVRGRHRELCIRTALGASSGDVLRSVIIEGMTPALVGIVIGVVAALGSARLLSTMVWGVSASDPVTLAIVAAGLALISLIASLLPAYRATRVDPGRVLRAS